MRPYERIAAHLIGTPLQKPAEWLRWLKGAPGRRAHPELAEIHAEERRIDAVMRRIIQADTHCIDIGCHLGTYLQKIVTLAPRAQHLAFEPVPQKALWLRRKFPRVSVQQAALTDSTGTADFFVHELQERLQRSGQAQR